MLIVIRLATPDDAEFLPAIERSAAQTFRLIEGLSWLAEAGVMSAERHRQLITLSTCWVAVDADNQPQGFLSAQLYGEDLHIHELSVIQTLQGQGVGRQLVEATMDAARSRHLRAVTLTTFCDVPWNAPFYQRLGFERDSLVKPDPRLTQILRDEYGHGFAPDSRCAMVRRVSR
ncbi:GNAT family N-acetyltransferase [Pseudomonas sp. ADAK18]|uniref:GNAT family N-acetyltransferase n=1 Tax=Pseudomonas sp. ADAK18 TaxID=2730848 RepID=UPI001464776A|nr:GNAT family N-acetyltransferase [Pseudomonas sp. ADAK18]QJI27454.1 GNAT family N-acetyltransferase [Pseudomonas sp. ADAK18]